MKVFQIYSVLVVVAIGISCKDDFCPGNEVCECIEEMQLPCDAALDSPDKSSLRAIIGNEPLCISEGEGGMVYSLMVFNHFTTYPGQIVSSNQSGTYNSLAFRVADSTIRDGALQFRLQTPIVPSDSFSISKELDKLAEVHNPIDMSEIEDDGYEFKMTLGCRLPYTDSYSLKFPDYEWIGFIHTKFPLSDEAYLRVVNFQKKDLGEAWKYIIDFEFGGMVLHYKLDTWREYGKVEEARFHTVSIVPK